MTDLGFWGPGWSILFYQVTQDSLEWVAKFDPVWYAHFTQESRAQFDRIFHSS